MKLEKSGLLDHTLELIIIGGIPRPVGGVTTFLRRLLYRDNEKIAALLDIYPDEKEVVRGDCSNKVRFLSGKVALWYWLWTNKEFQRGKELFFNFSTPQGPLILLCLPKVAGSRWSLMLHHGELATKGHLTRILARQAFRRVDKIKSLSEKQSQFYLSMEVRQEQIAASTSYCVPADHIDDEEALNQLKRMRQSYSRLTVMSGFPRDLYNFELGIAAMSNLQANKSALCLFIYGSGELRERLYELSQKFEWLFVFENQNEQFFNTILRSSDLLLRLTKTESFGISVWDADHWGVKIIASSVCIRPSSARLVDLKTPSESALTDLISEVLEDTGEYNC